MSSLQALTHGIPSQQTTMVVPVTRLREFDQYVAELEAEIHRLREVIHRINRPTERTELRAQVRTMERVNTALLRAHRDLATNSGSI